MTASGSTISPTRLSKKTCSANRNSVTVVGGRERDTHRTLPSFLAFLGLSLCLSSRAPHPNIGIPAKWHRCVDLCALFFSCFYFYFFGSCFRPNREHGRRDRPTRDAVPSSLAYHSRASRIIIDFGFRAFRLHSIFFPSLARPLIKPTQPAIRFPSSLSLPLQYRSAKTPPSSCA